MQVMTKKAIQAQLRPKLRISSEWNVRLPKPSLRFTYIGGGQEANYSAQFETAVVNTQLKEKNVVVEYLDHFGGSQPS